MLPILYHHNDRVAMRHCIPLPSMNHRDNNDLFVAPLHFDSTPHNYFPDSLSGNNSIATILENNKCTL